MPNQYDHLDNKVSEEILPTGSYFICRKGYGIITMWSSNRCLTNSACLYIALPFTIWLQQCNSDLAKCESSSAEIK